MRGWIYVTSDKETGAPNDLDWGYPNGYPLTARSRDQVAPVYTRVLSINFHQKQHL